MADSYDRYREALVMETETVWPAEVGSFDANTRAAVEDKLHATPDKVSQIDYVRTHTGFCRKITVTPADLAWAKK